MKEKKEENNMIPFVVFLCVACIFLIGWLCALCNLREVYHDDTNVLHLDESNLSNGGGAGIDNSDALGIPSTESSPLPMSPYEKITQPYSAFTKRDVVDVFSMPTNARWTLSPGVNSLVIEVAPGETKTITVTGRSQ